MQAGTEVRDLYTVQTIQPVRIGYEARVHDGRAKLAIGVRAPRVVVAAGGLNALKILLRSTAAGGGFDHKILAATGPFFPGSWLLRRLQRDTVPLFGFGPDAMDGEVKHSIFQQIVYDGVIHGAGMPRLGDLLTGQDVQDIHAYIVSRANEDRAAAALPPAPSR